MHRIMFLRDSYQTFHNKTVVGQPVGCIAFRMSDDLVEYGYSVLNPADSFNRKMARDIATGRMLKNPVTIRVPFGCTMHEVMESVMMDILDDKGAPGRARKAAREWLRHNSGG